jgi:protein ImuB
MFATIYLPSFYLQAATRHQPELLGKPVGLIEEQENKPVIIQLNAEAESAGIRKGMTPSQALARSLQVVIKVRARAQEKALAEILLQHAFTLSPYVEATAPGVCTIQFMDGTQPINGQDAHRPRQAGSLSSRVACVVDQLANCDIVAQAGIAPLPDISFLAAHLARPVLEIDDAKEFLAPLPIETLAIA